MRSASFLAGPLSFNPSLGEHGGDGESPRFLGTNVVGMPGWPQVAFALIGGSLSRRFKAQSIPS